MFPSGNIVRERSKFGENVPARDLCQRRLTKRPSKLKVACSNPAGVATGKIFLLRFDDLRPVLSNRVCWLDNFCS